MQEFNSERPPVESFISREIRNQALERARAMLESKEPVAIIKTGERTELQLKLENVGFSLVIDTFELDGETFYLGTSA